MGLSRELRDELARRDDTILALEMLCVDQACRLLALEALLLHGGVADESSRDSIMAHIAAGEERFRIHFEGSGLSGFIQRAQRMADELLASKRSSG
jgi:hypothetical protein